MVHSDCTSIEENCAVPVSEFHGLLQRLWVLCHAEMINESCGQ